MQIKYFLIVAYLNSVCLAISPHHGMKSFDKFISFKNIADTEHKNGDIMNAITHYSEAIDIIDQHSDRDEKEEIELVPSISSCRLSLALCQLKQGQYCESMKQCTKILHNIPRPHPTVRIPPSLFFMNVISFIEIVLFCGVFYS